MIKSREKKVSKPEIPLPEIQTEVFIYTSDTQKTLTPAEMEDIRRVFDLIRKQLDTICRSTECHPHN